MKVNKVFIASDHAGFTLKESIKKFLIRRKKKVLESCNFSIGGTQDILDNYCKRLGREANVDFADIENNYITTKMAFACLESIKQKSWVKI